MKDGQLTLKVYMLVFKRYWKRIIGTCLCWFLYDFCSYPFGLFSSTIVSQVNPQNTLIQNVCRCLRFSVVLILILSLLTEPVLDRMGDRY